MESRSSTHRYKVSLSVLELFNSEVYDLQDTTESKPCKLELCLDKNGSVEVKGIVQQRLCTFKDAKHRLAESLALRVSRNLKLKTRNEQSHCIVRIRVSSVNIITGTTYRARLDMVDLAGSEYMKQGSTSSSGHPKIHHINESLSSLGDIFHALATKRARVPFRNDKLTYVLSDSLGKSFA